MASSDPVGDMLAVIKNGNTRRHKRVQVPHSRLKEGVAKVLQTEGYLEDVKMVAEEGRGAHKWLHPFLKYDIESIPVITNLKRMSKPGCRVFRGVDQIGKVLDGLGVTVLSTSKGIMSDRQARRQRIGGELICKVW